MKRCEEEAWLDDYADGSLSEELLRRVELHLAKCEACRRVCDGIVQLRTVLAELPRGIEPDHDLWPKIAAQIASIPIGKSRFGFLIGWRAIAVAASILVAVGMTALAVRWRIGELETRPQVAVQSVSSDELVLAEVAKAEEAYTDAANSLLADLKATQSSLAPGVQQSLESNLAVTDQAISDIKSALAQHPNDIVLARKLFVVHERRVELLLDVAQISLSNRNGG